MDDADGLLEFGAHGDREIITGGGEAIHGGRPGDLPGTLHVLGGVAFGVRATVKTRMPLSTGRARAAAAALVLRTIHSMLD